jgi:hypothetical protein
MKVRIVIEDGSGEHRGIKSILRRMVESGELRVDATVEDQDIAQLSIVALLQASVEFLLKCSREHIQARMAKLNRRRRTAPAPVGPARYDAMTEKTQTKA